MVTSNVDCLLAVHDKDDRVLVKVGMDGVAHLAEGVDEKEALKCLLEFFGDYAVAMDERARKALDEYRPKD